MEAFRLSGKQIQVEEEEININLVFIIVQKEVNPAKKQTTKTPYRHPNYKRHFDQQQVQMNIHRRVMLSDKQEHQINMLRNKREVPTRKAVNKQLQ